jgi:hypothetical protein
MPKYKYKLKPPTKTTLKRLKEIQFYLFLESFLYKYNHDNQYIISMIESISSLYGCDPTKITILVDHFKSPVYKPTKEELVIGATLLGITVRSLNSITKIGVETYYRYINKYISSGEYDLEPRLTEIYQTEIDKFLSSASIMFSDVSQALKGIDIYDRY